MLVLMTVCSFGGLKVHGRGVNHKYATGDPVPLYANKVGPFHNPR